MVRFVLLLHRDAIDCHSNTTRNTTRKARRKSSSHFCDGCLAGPFRFLGHYHRSPSIRKTTAASESPPASRFPPVTWVQCQKKHCCSTRWTRLTSRKTRGPPKDAGLPLFQRHLATIPDATASSKQKQKQRQASVHLHTNPSNRTTNSLAITATLLLVSPIPIREKSAEQ